MGWWVNISPFFIMTFFLSGLILYCIVTADYRIPRVLVLIFLNSGNMLV